MIRPFLKGSNSKERLEWPGINATSLELVASADHQRHFESCHLNHHLHKQHIAIKTDKTTLAIKLIDHQN